MTGEDSVRKGLLLDEALELTLEELCRGCNVHSQAIIELVEVGVLEPRGREPERWRFLGPDLYRAARAFRFCESLIYAASRERP